MGIAFRRIALARRALRSIGDYQRNKLEISLGIIKLSLSKRKEAKGPILAAEVLIDPLLLAKKRKITSFESFPAFPPAIKDLALVVDENEPADSVRSAIESIAQDVAKGKFEVDPVTIFDLFSGKDWKKVARASHAQCVFGRSIAP